MRIGWIEAAAPAHRLDLAGLSSAAARHEPAGRTFWLARKTFAGSQRAFIEAPPVKNGRGLEYIPRLHEGRPGPRIEAPVLGNRVRVLATDRQRKAYGEG